MIISLIVKKGYNGEITLDLVDSGKVDLDKISVLPTVLENSSEILDLKEIMQHSQEIKKLVRLNEKKIFDLNKLNLCKSLSEILIKISKPYGVTEVKSYAFRELEKRPNGENDLIFIKSNMAY